MKRKEEVEEFLRQFKPKMSVWGLMFIRRGKNVDTLDKLGITYTKVEEIVRDIEAVDFCETIIDTMGSFGEMWVFGRDYEGHELYVKIAMGNPNFRTICISFHIAEHPMKYLFK